MILRQNKSRDSESRLLLKLCLIGTLLARSNGKAAVATPLERVAKQKAAAKACRMAQAHCRKPVHRILPGKFLRHREKHCFTRAIMHSARVPCQSGIRRLTQTLRREKCQRPESHLSAID
jgi:hypothetical protein